MLLSDVVEASARVAATPARNEKLAILADVLRRIPPEELPIGVAYLSGHLRQGRVGVGGSSLWGSRQGAGEPSPSLFDPAPESAAAVTLTEVDETFRRVAQVSGAGSSAARSRLLGALFARATPAERDFLERLVMGELRQGALAGMMEEAVARASEMTVEEVRRAAMRSRDLEAVAVAALAKGRAGLATFALAPFQPVPPMLAQPAADLESALARLGTAALEHKLDGARIQVHRAGDQVRVYTRRGNDVTGAVPEVVAAALALPLREAILDGEAIALQPDGRPHPFQVTMRRFGRTLDVERVQAELPLTTRLFDLLLLDGRDLLDAPARERYAALRERAPDLVMPRLVTADAAEAAAFLDAALAAGHEGLMAKSLDAPYEAGGRGSAWLKVKPAHTLDLVVLAVERGSGRRAGWLSNIHLGARDPDRGGFVMLGKTFKGMTDAMLEWQTRAFRELAVREDGHIVHLRPEVVVEIAFNDVQQSPRYPGGMALRLARVKRYRPDKTPEEADTVDTVREILRGRRAKRRG